MQFINNINNPLINTEMDFFNIGLDGQKVLQLIYSICNENKKDLGLIVLDKDTLTKWNVNNPKRKFSQETLRNGIKKLQTGSILSRPVSKYIYFINPSFLKVDA